MNADLIDSSLIPHPCKGAVMHYDYVAIPDREVPNAVEPAFQHIVSTYAS
jgi:hypothetical protein